MPLPPPTSPRSWSDGDLVELLHAAADAVVETLGKLGDWSLAGTQPGQYRSDLAADKTVVEVLTSAGLGVLSEESGLHHPERDIVVVVDPLDGSTNASRGLGWYATSLCAVDGEGPRASVVVDLPRGRRFEAVRGAGARLDGAAIEPSSATTLGDSVVGLSGYPAAPFGWRQYRVFGAVALDLCEVARGGLDAFVDCSPSAHGSWDYLGGMLVCTEAGAMIGDAAGRELVILEHEARRTPLAAATPELFRQVVEARRATLGPDR
jgi:fructose-1,6-bisphosphatase/inositol monophosphatase family enzyme